MTDDREFPRIVLISLSSDTKFNTAWVPNETVIYPKDCIRDRLRTLYRTGFINSY